MRASYKLCKIYPQPEPDWLFRGNGRIIFQILLPSFGNKLPVFMSPWHISKVFSCPCVLPWCSVVRAVCSRVVTWLDRCHCRGGGDTLTSYTWALVTGG